jgi:phosphoribosyl 1,2-cyclic phosphate phosphodiesterase
MHSDHCGFRATILGCGSSGGVPRLGGYDGSGDWGNCDPLNPKNKRRRCSLFVERIDKTGKTQVLIDASPDVREQLLSAKTGTLDALILTHDHADHIHGIDDMRMIAFNKKAVLPVWASESTAQSVFQRFEYAFKTEKRYHQILEIVIIREKFTISGSGGDIVIHPFDVIHGPTKTLGFRIGDLVYTPDVAEIPDASWDTIFGCQCWIVDALRYRPHPTHSHVEQTLSWIRRSQAERAILTNMHCEIDYDTVCKEIPDNVTAAYDGMMIAF